MNANDTATVSRQGREFVRLRNRQVGRPRETDAEKLMKADLTHPPTSHLFRRCRSNALNWTGATHCPDFGPLSRPEKGGRTTPRAAHLNDRSLGAARDPCGLPRGAAAAESTERTEGLGKGGDATEERRGSRGFSGPAPPTRAHTATLYPLVGSRRLNVRHPQVASRQQSPYKKLIMRAGIDGLELSASDLANHLGCHQLTQLDLAVAAGTRQPPQWQDPALAVLQERGLELEQAYLEHLRNQGSRIAELGPDDDSSTLRRTIAAMHEGVEVIYQAPLRSGRWHGRADFLRRVERHSRLGAWSYEVIDAKLAARPAPGPSCSFASIRTSSPISRACCLNICTSSCRGTVSSS